MIWKGQLRSRLRRLRTPVCCGHQALLLLLHFCCLALLQEDFIIGEDMCEKAANHKPPACLDILVAEGQVLK